MGRGVYLVNDRPSLLRYLSTLDNSPSGSLGDDSKTTSPVDRSTLTDGHISASIYRHGLKDGQGSNHIRDFSSPTCPAYIQEYYPHDRDIRVVIIGKEIVLAYWRVSHSNDFRANISCGGEILFAPVPKKALELALYTAVKCGWDDVGLDIVEKKGDFFVIEANMKYGRKGFLQAGIDYHLLLENLISNGKI
ncbi:MAG: hypothetical protein HQK61_01095 [Desulfamplus sp.]|nr:hypothetical protein [Desulfamplus sp.]